MANTNKAQGPYPRITIGLPDIQDQIRLVHKLCAAADDRDLDRLNDLGNLLYDLYTQLQHKKQVTIYRFANKSSSGPKTGNRRR